MRVAVCQMRSGDDVDANLACAESLLREAADGGADLAALPELFPFLGPSADVRRIAEPLAESTPIRTASAVARERSMWVLAGSVPERDGDRIHNTSVLLDRTGEPVARYRKIHLFDVELPGQRPFRESATYAGGTELVTHETELGRLGLAICYDLRFPELFRGLMTLGAEVLTLPAQFQWETGKDHWHVLVRARAIEDQCFVIAPAQWGEHDGGRRRSYGHSLVVDPWGRVLVEAPEEGDGVWFAELDLAEQQRVRRSLPALSHRRLGPAC